MKDVLNAAILFSLFAWLLVAWYNCDWIQAIFAYLVVRQAVEEMR